MEPVKAAPKTWGRAGKCPLLCGLRRLDAGAGHAVGKVAISTQGGPFWIDALLPVDIVIVLRTAGHYADLAGYSRGSYSSSVYG